MKQLIEHNSGISGVKGDASVVIAKRKRKIEDDADCYHLERCGDLNPYYFDHKT